MKHLFLVCFCACFLILPFNSHAKGGFGPCLATCFLGDTRIGLSMNEGGEIETQDWIRFGASLVGGGLGSATGTSALSSLGAVARAWAAYENGYKQAGITGFLVSCFWGPRPGRMFKEYKLRTKEWLMCIPIFNIYPCIALPLEAYEGKTMTEVIEAEGLKRQ